ncbi:MAG: hypothetical protein WCY84_05715 [Candidatus Cloacimonadaceae bacterium]
MKKILAIIALSLVLMPLVAQYALPKPSFSPYSMKKALPNLNMSHSMGFEAGSSSKGEGYYLSRYTNHINYALSPNLGLKLDLNFVNIGGLNTSKSLNFGKDNESMILPDFSLHYQPKENLSFELRVGKVLMQRGYFSSFNDNEIGLP